LIRLALANKKGGVAKTTSTANLAAEFSARGDRVLCVDMDPQQSLTLIAGYDPEEVALAKSTAAAMVPEDIAEAKPLRDLLVDAPWGGQLLLSPKDFAEVEQRLADPSTPGPNRRLGRALDAYKPLFDVVLIDSQPGDGRLWMNAICAADYLLLPVSLEYQTAGGLGKMLRAIEGVRQYEQPELEVLGAFKTMAARTRHAREIEEALHEALDGSVHIFDTTIPHAVAVKNAQAEHKAVRDFHRDGKPSLAYYRLANEIVDRIEERSKARQVAQAA
jgi:chromosome partitioning protein